VEEHAAAAGSLAVLLAGSSAAMAGALSGGRLSETAGGGRSLLQVQRSLLCFSLGCRRVELLCIQGEEAGAWASSGSSRRAGFKAGAAAGCGSAPGSGLQVGAAAAAGKPVVAITARVHPGESCASWVMQVGRRRHACLPYPGKPP
jgi:hypothetical protein